MRQSMRIIEQALGSCRRPSSPTTGVSAAAQAGVYSNIEDLMNHFKLICTDPAAQGEVYGYTEAANASWLLRGERRRQDAARVKCGRPRSASISRFAHDPGAMIADAVATIGGSHHRRRARQVARCQCTIDGKQVESPRARP